MSEKGYDLYSPRRLEEYLKDGIVVVFIFFSVFLSSFLLVNLGILEKRIFKNRSVLFIIMKMLLLCLSYV